MGRYAAGTTVSSEKTQTEIRRVLERYGASRIGLMTEPGKATIYFQVKDRDVQMAVPLVRKGDPFVERIRGQGYKRVYSEDGAERESRRRWRVMVLTLKAMLEAVESKVTTFDEVFLAHVVIPGTGRTVGEALVPRLGSLATSGLRALLAENPEVAR